MSNSSHKNSRSDAVLDQFAGAQVAFANAGRAASEEAATAIQEDAYSAAMAQIQITRIDVNDHDHILGNVATKHGEMAESVEVGVRRARDALHGREFSADVEANRTSHVDYWVDGKAVQSKFINGTNKGLDHVLKHMDKYKQFGGDGQSYYHIPKDQYQLIAQVRAGNTGELSDRTINALKSKIEAIELKTGKPFEDVVKPATSTYAEVQHGKVNETLDQHEGELDSRNEELKDDIRQQHKPSLQGGLRTAATAGAVAGAFGFAASAGRKYFKEKKNIFRGDFTKQDWKDVGLDTGKTVVAGAVTGGAVYLLTNYVGASAPLASAFVSTVKGLEVLVQQQRAGKLSEGGFVDEALLLCTDVALVSLASAAGQTLIPIPVLGALVGSFAGKFACEVLKGMSAKSVEAIQDRVKESQKQLTNAFQAKLRQLEIAFLPSVTMMEYAFDVENNRALLQSSLTLARMQGVAEYKLIKHADETLAFLSNPNAGAPQRSTANRAQRRK